MTQTHSKTVERPLSPHLSVYRWSITMALSIMHRATGMALSAGAILLVWFLYAVASGPEAYGLFYNFAASWVGKFMLLGWTFSLYFHLGTGIRHLILDAGYLYNIKNSDRSGIVIIASSVVLTALTWVCIAQNIQ